MAIKNYTSNIPINRIFARLQKTLAEHGAKQIMFDYGEDGKIYGVFFIVNVKDKPLRIKLPAKVDKAAAILKQQYQRGLISSRKVLEPEQAYSVAWRNILDWTEAQMALLDIEMARMEEVFLPYMATNGGKTLFEIYDEKGFKLPELQSGNEPIEGEVIAGSGSGGGGGYGSSDGYGGGGYD